MTISSIPSHQNSAESHAVAFNPEALATTNGDPIKVIDLPDGGKISIYLEHDDHGRTYYRYDDVGSDGTYRHTGVIAPDGLNDLNQPFLRKRTYNKNSDDSYGNPDYFDDEMTPSRFEKYGGGSKPSPYDRRSLMSYEYLIEKRPGDHTPSAYDLPFGNDINGQIQKVIDENTAPKLPPVETPAQDTSKAIQA